MTDTWPAKFGDEVLDYEWDWTERLEEGEEIVPDSVSVTIRGPASIEIDSHSTTDGVTKVWISGGGNLGSLAVISLLAETSTGRLIGEKVRLPIKSR